MFRNAYVLLLLTALFWAGNAVAGKLAVGHVSPLLLNLIRWVLALAVLLAIGLPQLRRDWPAARANLALLSALGAAGFSFFNAAMYSALLHTSAVNVSIEQAAAPMLVFAANFLFYRVGVAPGQVAGFALSLAGVALTATHGDLARLAGLDLNRGDALMLLAICVYAGYTAGLRRKPALHWQSAMIVMCAAAAVSAMPFAVWEWLSGRAVLPDARGWAVVAYTTVFPSMLAQVFYMRGVELIGPNRAGLFVNMVPVFGTLLSIAILGEAFGRHHAASLALVMGGIWLAERSGRRRDARNPG